MSVMPLREVLDDMSRDMFTANAHVERWKESIVSHLERHAASSINTTRDGYVLVPARMNERMRGAFYDGDMDLTYGGWVDPDSCWNAVLAPFVAEASKVKAIRAHVLDLLDEGIDFYPEPLFIDKLESARATVAGLLSLLSELIDIEGPLPGNLDWHKRATEFLAKATGAA